MIAQLLVAGGATLVVALALFQLWLKTPPRSVCPRCGDPTTAVTHALLATVERWVRLRWCSACGWRGWGRNGPVLSRRLGPVSDGSGFRWGPERLPMDFGFRWAEQPAASAAIGDPPAESPSQPAHPSGFRWACASDASETACVEATSELAVFRFRAPTGEVAAAAHPSGFRWGATSGPSALDEPGEPPRWSHRSGPTFRWAGSPGAEFRWSEQRAAAPTPGGPPRFRWKD